MKAIANIAIVVGIISLVVGVISRISMTPIALVKGGLSGAALVGIANTCFLIAILCILQEKK